MSEFEVVTKSYSDIDMADPSDWENGYKEGLVKRFGDAERALSDPRTGEQSPSTFDVELIDDRRFREQLASLTTFWGPDPWTVKMTSRANRAIKGQPYTVWVGALVNAQPTRPSGFKFTLADMLSETLFGRPSLDVGQIPWRKIGDGCLNQLVTVAEDLDRDGPEPIIYGINKRVPAEGDRPGDAASQFGFCVVPRYLGIMPAGDPLASYHVWLVAGHACADIPTIRVDSIEKISDEGTAGQWLVPHHAGHTAAFDGNPYNDYPSSTYHGITRRYTLIFGKRTNTDPETPPADLTDPDACAAGHKQLTVSVEGIEPNGDGSGDVITDRIQQYKHFLINFIANRGPESYQSGAWLSNPTWDVFGEPPVTKIDEESFDACSAIAIARLPPDGYPGAAVMGATSSDRRQALQWTAAWNRSCGLTTGPTRRGQWRAVMLHPTDAIKAASPLFTDVNEIRDGSFEVDVRWSSHASSIPFKADLNPATGVWMTAFTAIWQPTIDRYGRDIPSEPIEYQFAPGITASYHLARLEAIRSQHPPKYIQLETTVVEQDGSSLAYLDIGDYFNYRHYLSVSRDRWEERLAQIIAIQVQVGTRRVRAIGIDCEDLIGYDAAPEVTFTPGTPNDTCANAIDMGDLSTPYDETIDTTDNATDGSATGFGGSGVAYHAAWFKVTGNIYDGVATFSSLGSDYDTQIAVFSGSCGGLVQQGYNDNFGVLRTSALDVSIVGGTDYFILVCGYGPDDGGLLEFRAVFTPNP